MRFSLSRSAGLRLTGLGIIGTSLLVAASGPGVFAGLKAEANTAINPMAATTGTLVVALDGTASFASSIANMKPGDSGIRYIRLDNTGTLAARSLKVKVDATGDAVLISGAKALTIKVDSCTQEFTAGSCSGTGSTQIGATVVSGLASFTDFSGAPTLTAASNSATTDSLWLKVTMALPDTDETTSNGSFPTGTVQAKSANLVFTFQEAQQEGVSTL